MTLKIEGNIPIHEARSLARISSSMDFREAEVILAPLTTFYGLINRRNVKPSQHYTYAAVTIRKCAEMSKMPYEYGAKNITRVRDIATALVKEVIIDATFNTSENRPNKRGGDNHGRETRGARSR